MKKLFYLLLLSLITHFSLQAQTVTQGGATPVASPEQQIQTLQQQMQQVYQYLNMLNQELLYLRQMVENNVVLNVSLDASSYPTKGNENASLTLIEFSDYQCPFCSTFSKDISPKIDEEFVATGKIKKVFYDFPIMSIHPNAFAASKAGRCAGEQGKYWEMHDELFNTQQNLNDLTVQATTVGLNLEEFNACFESTKYDEEIKNGIDIAADLGIRSTPTIALGFEQPDGSIKIVKFLRGAGADFSEIINGLLEKGSM